MPANSMRITPLGKIVIRNEETAHKDISIDPTVVQNNQLLKNAMLKRLRVLKPAIESLQEEEAEIRTRSVSKKSDENVHSLLEDLNKEHAKIREILHSIESIPENAMQTAPVQLNRLVDISRELKGYLIEDEIDRTLERLGEILIESSDFYNEFIVLSAQFKRAVRSHRTGIMPYLQFNETMNKMILALTGIIDLLEAEDVMEA